MNSAEFWSSSLSPYQRGSSSKRSKSRMNNFPSNAIPSASEGPLQTSNEMQVQCKYCGLCLPHGQYRNHMKTAHHDIVEEFPYVCSVCNKGFYSQIGLTYHSEKHSANKFECKFCSKQFSYSRNLKRHLEVFHLLKECRFCKQLFSVGQEHSRHTMQCAVSVENSKI